ncbi:metal-dependent hydrolase [Halogeometricum borinquense DSM 11551]|uniref:Metal-dependent hydrolase n=2 Tax=Halogeometricum borinquense TaxID=60847 RepID=E4NR84_HALBP|nr:MBL fold metallo-hydrolase [Halogeometricum borinquense]ADQ66820.1 metal-dependent hydrolase, beta-lactamase superfamily III [Halogeometricum borinquense DSM 11551]ELY30328.1 metal-dependent hydrolase [Halogeometricum borinquense DSM 11551]RYJ14052.1 MBL fold metallo-hydrolase [Halogeometricum borinquense]
MRVTFLGTGSAMPLPDRVQTGLLVESDERSLLVDCGSGVLNRLTNTDVGYEGIGTVLLTHHHLDHVSDLLALLKARWLAGETHLEVVGPTGTKRLLDGLLDVHDYLQDRVELRIREVTAGSFEVAGFEIEATETRHSKDCLAYRFHGDSDAGDDDRSGGDFVFSGDSEAFEGLANFADGAAVLAHDCSFPDEVDVSNHPTPAQLGEALAGYDIGRVYLTHLYPHTEGKHEEMLQSIGDRYDGDVRFARDGLRIDI